MTEDEARAVLATFDAVGWLEHWIATRPWEPTLDGGWTVPGDLGGWRFRVEPAPGGVRVIARAGGGGEPAVWWVPRPRVDLR
ncbi:MAG: hypothetical protein ICV73_10605 [Acetobacteraceae bacterium]|nr:hypothetical protein [Acetobacteraceae bacterium]